MREIMIVMKNRWPKCCAGKLTDCLIWHNNDKVLDPYLIAA
jgi:hypothetical protein